MESKLSNFLLYAITIVKLQAIVSSEKKICIFLKMLFSTKKNNHVVTVYYERGGWGAKKAKNRVTYFMNGPL